MDGNAEIDGQLLSYLLDELNPEGRRAVEAWIFRSGENRAYFDSFRKIHIALQGSVQQEAIRGSYTGWRRRIQGRRMPGRWMRVAAAVVLLLGAGLAVWLLRPVRPGAAPEVAQTEGRPGSAKAVLYLSSGQRIEVDSSRRKIQERDGTTIYVSQEGSLDYRPGEQTTVPDQLQNRLDIPRGGEFHLTLNDGTQVWLNSESELEYPTQFSGEKRVVKLKGEAYFHVTHMKRCPFVVEVGDMQVQVYGTRFNINTHTPGKIETVLVKGSVGLSRAGQPEVKLRPGEKADYRTGSGEVVVEQVDVLPFIAWKDGYFMFHNEHLDSILEKLSRWYDLDVFYLHPGAKKVRFSGMMERYSDIRGLLRYFEKISEVRFQVKGNTVVVE